jgi:hypothetical protein
MSKLESEHAAPRPPNPQKALYRYAFALAIVISAALSITFFVIDNETSTKVKLASAGASLGSSVVFALIFTGLANREFNQLIREEIRASFRAHSATLLTEIREWNRDYLPTDRYPGTAGFDSSFNRDLMRDLQASTLYTFRGASAKYVPVRVAHSGGTLTSLRVIVLNPNSGAAVQRRARDRAQNPKYAGVSAAELQGKLLTEVRASVIALFDCRFTCAVDISFVDSEPAVTRLELLDGAAYVSLYHSGGSAVHAYPETVRFDRSNALYSVYLLETNRQFEDAPMRTRFGSRDGDSDLDRHLTSLGLGATSLDELATIRIANKAFADEFLTHLRSL